MFRQLRYSRASSLTGSLRAFPKKADEQRQHHHAAGVHQKQDKRKRSYSRKQEKTNASEQSPENRNAREPNTCAPSLRNADVVPTVRRVPKVRKTAATIVSTRTNSERAS